MYLRYRECTSARPAALRASYELMTRTSWHVVPLWPQLAEILRPYVFGPPLELGHGSEEMVRRVYSHRGRSGTGRKWSSRSSSTSSGSVISSFGLGLTQDWHRTPLQWAGNETPASSKVQAGDGVPEWARRDSNARPLAPEPPDASDGQRPLA
jgi:hypothetical protein